MSVSHPSDSKANLQAEGRSLNFEGAKSRAQAEWKRELGQIQVQGPDEASKTKFYTGLFHALLGRGIAKNLYGSLPRHDGTIGHLP